MVLGKFMPPHAGHMYLCNFARAWCDDLAIVVGSLAREPIPGAQRVAWMRELFPDAHVVHHTDENPQLPEDHPRFWEIWEASLRRVLPWPVDWVFAGEAYGEKLAEVLGARFVPVDRTQGVRGVSGTAVRADPAARWDDIPACVRPWFVKRVSVFGPESTGKSTLAARLAEELGTIAVPEYARLWLEPRGGRIEAADIEAIARGQLAAEDALARSARHVLVCDTDLLATTIWSDVLFGSCPAWIREEAARRRYDLTLLCDVDVPWVADPVRYLPDERASFLTRCEDALRANGRAWVKIEGSWDERLETALAAVRALARSG